MTAVTGALRGRLEGRRVLVTGANRGIDAAMRRHGPRLVPVSLDVTDPDSVRNLLRECPGIDVLVSNAGREGSGRVLGHDEADARHLFEVHLWGPWRLADALAPGVAESAGGMVFVQSIAALALSRRGPFYSASKAAATMMAAAVRESLRTSGAVVTNVFPGFTDTDMLAADDVPKASPLETAELAMSAWAAGHESVFPDRFAALVHERLRTDVDSVLDRPGATVTELYREYLLGG